MKTINLNDRIKYLGELNDWTFNQKLEKNIKGTVTRISHENDKMNYEIEFDNGIRTTIDIEDLEVEL